MDTRNEMGPITYISLCLLGCLIFNPSLAGPALSVQAQEASCPREWLSFQGNCYGYFSEKKSWMEAADECHFHEHGAHLASIHSAGENDVLVRYVRRHHKKSLPIWIGLWDPDQNLTWKWADESQVNFLAWDRGQPDGPKKNEHCTVLSHYAGFKKWDDYPCEDKFPFVCKHSP